MAPNHPQARVVLRKDNVMPGALRFRTALWVLGISLMARGSAAQTSTIRSTIIRQPIRSIIQSTVRSRTTTAVAIQSWIITLRTLIPKTRIITQPRYSTTRTRTTTINSNTTIHRAAFITKTITTAMGCTTITSDMRATWT